VDGAEGVNPHSGHHTAECTLDARGSTIITIRDYLGGPVVGKLLHAEAAYVSPLIEASVPGLDGGGRLVDVELLGPTHLCNTLCKVCLPHRLGTLLIEDGSGVHGHDGNGLYPTIMAGS
jgi:hypothetical protein